MNASGVAARALGLLFATASVASVAAADVSLMRNSTLRRDRGPASLSGITFAGGDAYYAVADNGTSIGLYPLTLVRGTNGYKIEECSVGACIPLEGRTKDRGDIEGVAFDPGSGNVWVSDEGTQEIVEHDPSTGKAMRRVEVPPIYSRARDNLGFEALTISGDGLTLWTANEEALECDGPRSSLSNGTTVRLAKFRRRTVRGDWSLVAMYAYQTDCWHQPYDYGGTGRRGVSDLCALPDGSLLVLEREMSSSAAGTGAGALLGAAFYFAIYRVTAEAMAVATDVSGFDGGLAGVSGWSPVEKVKLRETTDSFDDAEGICLSRRKDDSSAEIVVLTDAGDGYSNPSVIQYTLSGLNIHTLGFERPPVGTATLEGVNFRFLEGETVTVSLGAESWSVYPIDGTVLPVCDGWTLSNHDPGVGTGASATFVVAADGVLSWQNVRQEVAAAGYLIADSFEGLAAGARPGTAEGWSGGDCRIEMSGYLPPVPPGFAMGRETHTKVLDAAEGEATRNVPSSVQGEERLDLMACLWRSPVALMPVSRDVQIQLSADERGRLCIWHLYEEDGVWRTGWSPLSEKAYEDGEWVRIEVDFDYTSSRDGDAFASVKVNGSCQPTAHGVRSPTDLRPYGPWHYLAKNRRTGGVSLPQRIRFVSAKVDDLMLCRRFVDAEHAGPTSVGGIEFSWFDNAGLPRDPLAAAPFVPGYTLGEVYATGLDPYSDRPFEVTGFALDANGKPHIEFNGYKGDDPSVYRILHSLTPDFKNPTMLDDPDGSFVGDAASWSTTWTGKSDAPTGAGFYKVNVLQGECNENP